jgi:hypothetical protein
MAESELIVFQQAREGAQRFEYFLLGISLALCAYEGKTLSPQKLGLNAYTIEVLAVLLIIVSVIFGFKHIQMMIATSSLNHEILTRQGKRSRLIKGELMYDDLTGVELTDWQRQQGISQMGRECRTIEAQVDSVRQKSTRYHHWRVWFLIAGIAALVASKVVSPYL